MKTKLWIICLFVIGSANAQTEVPGQMFELVTATNATFLQFINYTSNDKAIQYNDEKMMNEKVLFILQSVDKDNDRVTFYAKNFNSSSNPIIQNTNRDKSFYYNDKLFYMTYKDYKSNAKDAAYPDRFNFGILTLPFKYRPQKNADFDAEFNLNTTLGYLLRSNYFRKTKIYIQGGVGIGNINLDTSNASKIDDDKSHDASAITAFAGVMLQYDNLQAGLYFGVDSINKNAQYDWVNQGNIWISVGIGFKVFTLSKAKENNNQ